jgi:hypothetical protein
VHRAGKWFETIVKGQFDIVGFDPRGINLTRVSRDLDLPSKSLHCHSQPYVSCFESELQQQVFQSSTGFDAGLNLPANMSAFMPGVVQDLEHQVTRMRVATASLARKCRERTGDALAYMGITGRLQLAWAVLMRLDRYRGCGERH